MARHTRKCYTFEDNYTEQAYIAPLVEQRPNGDEVEVHGAVRFTYKAMGPVDCARWEGTERESSEAYCRKRAAMLAERIVSWDIPVPLAASSIVKLVPRLFWRLCNIIQGTSETDIDPQWDAAKQKAATELIAEAAAAGTTGAVLGQAADEKNSVAG